MEDATSRDVPASSSSTDIASTPMEPIIALELTAKAEDGTNVLPLGDYLVVLGKILEVSWYHFKWRKLSNITK